MPRKKSRIAYIKDIARQRIQILLSLAEREAPRRPERAKRYVELALTIAKRARVRIPRRYKFFICKKCHSYLVPGVNATVRLRTRRMPHVVVRCHTCGAIKRLPYLREKKARRAGKGSAPQGAPAGKPA